MNRIATLLLTVVITLSFPWITDNKTCGQNTDDKPISLTIPADIYKIIQSSCIDCHAKGGKKMAMSHVNFSEWDNYSAEKKATKAADMAKMLQNGKMPPKLYRESHPETVPTPTQIENIVKWADSLPKK